MSTAEPWTVGRLLQWTTDYLKSHASESPRLDAEVLLAEVLHCPRIELYTAFDDVPNETARSAFREFVRLRAAGTPVAYLVGRREFYSLSFQVTPDVLVPRPETELLVVAVLDLAKAREGQAVSSAGNLPSMTVADVGTGSGVIAVCLAKHLPACRATALDISPAALAVARRNAAALGVAEKIDFVASDLLAATPPERHFDFIVSNPPYVTAAEFERLPRDVRDHEPRAALLAGPRGTEVIERLIPQAADRLCSGGHLLIEIGPAIHEAVRGLLEADGRFELVSTIKDLARHPRVVQATRRP